MSAAAIFTCKYVNNKIFYLSFFIIKQYINKVLIKLFKYINNICIFLVLMLITLYRISLSFFFANCCRFEVSCSLYAICLLKKYNL